MKLSGLSLFLLFLSIQQSNSAWAEPQNLAGKVQFFNQADSDFDQFTINPDIAQKTWMRNHYTRMLVYSPYFDTRLAWYPDGLVYVDAYAIYENSALAKEHPEWIMKDAQGQKLYIPWNCDKGRCDQFAGDFSHPAFKAYMIDKMKAILAKGYRGLWLDDVNLTWRVSDGNGKHITPMDKNTGKAMALADWQRYFSEYMEAVRAAFPKVEIAHNAIWHADTMSAENPYITRQIKAADYINLERGATDAGLVAGDGQWGFQTFLKYIDYVHKLDADVIMMDYGTTPSEREYGLAAWFLISQGHDLMASNQLAWTAPNNWWSDYSLNLGRATNERYEWQGLLRRDFQCGMVLLNQPGRSDSDADLGGAYKNLIGEQVAQVKLAGKSAAILQTACSQKQG